MYCKKYLLVLFVFVLTASCSEDDSSGDLPAIEVESLENDGLIFLKKPVEKANLLNILLGYKFYRQL